MTRQRSSVRGRLTWKGLTNSRQPLFNMGATMHQVCHASPSSLQHTWEQKDQPISPQKQKP